VIPSYTQTFSKGPSQYVQGVAPGFIARGEGSHVWDVDGNEYIDYPMALGPIILGHNYPAVTEAVMRQMRYGSIFSLSHPLEVEVAELLVEIIPSAEMVRFSKNGSDATSGAVRVARAYTGRDIIACCGYHGWQDWYIGTTTRNKGVPEAVQELTIPFDYNDFASLERIFAENPGQIAAVIMEPVGVVEPRDDFLQKIRRLTEREGAILIFDEIITGFRVGLGGAQEYFDVTPDLTCCGKAMGNGYPVAAIAGRRDIMEWFDEIFFSSTFGGEALSLAAAKATITEMREKKVIEHLWAVGLRLRDGYNVLAKEYGIAQNTECLGLGPRTSTSFKGESETASLELKSLFQQECLKRGVLFLGGHNMSYSHSDADVDQTLRVYRTAMEICSMALKEGDVLERLEGPPVQPVFRHA
jgi:glutamate-1-semialdehyde 2,1-aminomutase/spore coat polysaccharide biosynthesis protein SpsF